MKKVCPTHGPETTHILTFHLFCMCYENLRSEHWKKLKLKIGGEEILSHFWELEQLLYMFRIVTWCSIMFMLWVFVKNQRIRMFEQGIKGARFSVWKVAGGWRQSPLGWAWFIFLFAHSFSTYTPLAHCVLFLSFLIVSFLFWLIYFLSKYKKYKKYFLNLFCIYFEFICFVYTCIYK